jgi:hypothetical protein
MVNRPNYSGETMRLIATLIISVGTLMLTGCNAPGANGQYATHDRGNGSIDKSAPWYASPSRY